MSDEKKPRFKQGMLFGDKCLAVDEDGVAWWINPYEMELYEATPGRVDVADIEEEDEDIEEAA